MVAVFAYLPACRGTHGGTKQLMPRKRRWIMATDTDDAGTGPTTAPYVVILNSESGKDSTKPSADEIVSSFRARGKTARVVTVAGGDDIIGKVKEVIEQPGIECVVAAGGDGTICAVAGALSERGIDLGVLPLGTFNYFARRFGIPEDAEGAIDAVCDDRSVTINLGSVNGRIFINNASMGLYPAILRVREDIYNRWGRSRLAAYWSVLVAMVTIYQPMRMRIEVDGTLQRAKTPTVFVAMSAYQLDEFGIVGADAVRDGKLAVYLAPDCNRFTLIWKAIKVIFRGVQKGKDFTLLTGEHTKVVTRKRSQLVALDGERERMEGPFDFSIVKNALAVRVPAEVEGAEQAA